MFKKVFIILCKLAITLTVNYNISVYIMQTTKNLNAVAKQAQQHVNNATQTAMLAILNANMLANKVSYNKKQKQYTAKSSKYVIAYISKFFVAQIIFASKRSISYNLSALAINANFAQTNINNAQLRVVTKATFNKHVAKVKATTVYN